MTQSKHRLSVTVDPELFQAGQREVRTDQADSIGAWVSTAVEDKIHRDRKLGLLRAALAGHAREFGKITEAEIAAQQRADRAQAGSFAADATEGRGRRDPRA